MQKIKATPELALIPVMMVTAKGGVRYRSYHKKQELMVIFQPFSLSRLVERISVKS